MPASAAISSPTTRSTSAASRPRTTRLDAVALRAVERIAAERQGRVGLGERLQRRGDHALAGARPPAPCGRSPPRRCAGAAPTSSIMPRMICGTPASTKTLPIVKARRALHRVLHQARRPPAPAPSAGAPAFSSTPCQRAHHRDDLGVLVELDAERLGDAVGGDVVVGRADAAGGDHVVVAGRAARSARSMISASMSGTTRASARSTP